MILVNRATGKGEMLTQAEFEAKYGPLPQPGPHKAKAEVLRQQRVSEGVGLRELAKVMDLPPSYVSKIEQGHVEITPALVEQYKKALLTIELTGRSAT